MCILRHPTHRINPGSTRYFYIQNALLDGKYMTAGYLVLFISLFIAAVLIVMFGILIGVAAMS